MVGGGIADSAAALSMSEAGYSAYPETRALPSGRHTARADRLFATMGWPLTAARAILFHPHRSGSFTGPCPASWPLLLPRRSPGGTIRFMHNHDKKCQAVAKTCPGLGTLTPSTPAPHATFPLTEASSGSSVT
jgi:hypothetical protein